MDMNKFYELAKFYGLELQDGTMTKEEKKFFSCNNYNSALVYSKPYQLNPDTDCKPSKLILTDNQMMVAA